MSSHCRSNGDFNRDKGPPSVESFSLLGQPLILRKEAKQSLSFPWRSGSQEYESASALGIGNSKEAATLSFKGNTRMRNG